MASNDFRNFIPSNYSNQYSTLQQHHLEQLREEILGNKEDASVKNKKLSAETNKRRRDLINRKKARESEEENRRNEILAERKARIQDVTHRYQRGSAPKASTPNHYQRSKSPRNKRSYSAPVSRNNQINLDDALRTIRGNTQLQYNVGDSGTVFLQKYGAHLHQSNHQTNQRNSTNTADTTSKHRLAVREHANNNNGTFEQQHPQHHANLNKSKVDSVQVFNEKFLHDTLLDGDTNSYQDVVKHDDTHSIESLDSLDSEQPSYRSHVINSGASRDKSASSINNNLGVSEHLSGGDTYRQESPTVLLDDKQRPKAPTTSHNRVQSAPVHRQTSSTTATPTTDPYTFLGFQVVNTSEYRLQPTEYKLSRPQETLENKNHRTQVNMQQTDKSYTSATSQNTKLNYHQQINAKDDGDVRENVNNVNSGESDVSFYLKSRTEPQPLISEFPAHAWSLDESPPLVDECEPEQQTFSFLQSHASLLGASTLPADCKTTSHADTFSDTASDSGAPRGILKKRGTKAASLPRSHSTPSIRDSLEVTKQHFQSSTYKGDTPKSAKKSVRFSEKNSEPVFFQKGSSPSSIPRPVNSLKPKSNPGNVPHISSAITPNVSDKSLSTKQQSHSPHKGPVVATHSISKSQSGKTIGAEGKTADSAEAGKGKTTLMDIRLDRTPTDNEIDILWDKVRDCLQESPASSVRSAPADLQQQRNEQHTANGICQNSNLPPKQPIRKITASNINQIGQRAQSAAVRRQTSCDSAQSPLQRPKQDQPSFIHQQPDVGHNQVTRQPHQGAKSVSNGNMGVIRTPHNGSMMNNASPVRSALEPNQSAAGTQHNVSESMMSYLAAEQLAGHESMSDNDIIKALSDTGYREQLGGGEQPTAPMSALSMEEQRIMQSIDRLNEKLQVVEDGSLSNRSQLQTEHQQAYNGTHHNGFDNLLTHHKAQLKPHPPYTGTASVRSFSATPRGFRGHRPIQPRQRTASADTVRHTGMNTTVAGTNKQFRLY